MKTHLAPPSIVRLGLCWLCIAALATVVRAQSSGERSQTQERLAALQTQIQSLEQQRRQTAQQEAATLETLEQTTREIKVRQALIATYRDRIAQLKHESDSLRRSMSGLEEQLKQLKQEYRTRAVHAYKYGRLYDLALILSAESINQMFIRVKYLRQFALQRKRKREAIHQTTQQLSQQQTGLKETIAENRRLLKESQQERQALVQLKEKRAGLVKQLRQEQNTLEEELAQKRKAAQQLEDRLKALFAEESNRSRDARSLAETRALTGSFQENKGQLPWPVEGVITEDYGTHAHEVYGTKTVSPGITIQTTSAEEVYAVFNGTVSKVLIMPGYGSCAIARHGKYMSVYCNLSSLYVREGDAIHIGERIAHAGTAAEPLGTALFFGLFTGESHIDPTSWLRAQ